MKKAVFYVLALALFSLMLSSCSKDYVCECTWTSTASWDEGEEYTEKFDYEDYSSKSLAEELCEEHYIAFAENEKCTLK